VNSNSLEQNSTVSAASGSDSQQHLSQTLNTHPKQSGNDSGADERENALVLQKYGVTRINDHGMIEYRLAGSADDTMLFETKAGAGEFAFSEHQLEVRTAAKIRELKSEYGVSFSADGENAVRPWVASKSNPDRLIPGAMLKARAPRLTELMGVEAALQSSQPSQFTSSTSHAALKFYFLKTPSFGSNTYDAGLFAADEKGKASVFFEPDKEPDRPITAADAVQKHQDIKTSIEALAAHEIAHNAEFNMGLGNLDKLKPVAEQIGWTISSPGSDFYLLKGNNNGEYFRLTNDGLSSDKGWIRCALDGSAMDDNGNPVADPSKAPHLTNAEVRQRALIKPPTDYFTAPDEELADSLMLYRVGEDGRKQLMSSGLQLYNVVKGIDQSEIDARFGTNGDGTAKKIRMPNGSLADNDEKTQSIATQFEQSLVQ
jgi:hypothetical protein